MGAQFGEMCELNAHGAVSGIVRYVVALQRAFVQVPFRSYKPNGYYGNGGGRRVCVAIIQDALNCAHRQRNGWLDAPPPQHPQTIQHIRNAMITF